MNTIPQKCKENFHVIIELFSPYVRSITEQSSYCHFQNFSYNLITKLHLLGLLDLQQTQNDSPSIGAFLDFASTNKTITFHGYIIGPMRDDCRISIEGMHLSSSDPKEREAFILFCRSADELEVNNDSLYSWWD